MGRVFAQDDVEWHLRRVWAPVLFEDETLALDRQTRDPVLPAQPSAAVRDKKVTRQTSVGAARGQL